MKSKHEKSTNDRCSQERNTKIDKYEKNDVKTERFYRMHSRSSSPRNSDTRKSVSDERNTKSDKIDHDIMSIYIGNVDYSATEEELRNAFIECGDIVRVTIIKNMKTGHPKGAAFIEFADKDGVETALTLNGKDLKGRPLIVTSKKPRPESRSKISRESYRFNKPRSHIRSTIGVSSNRQMQRRLPQIPMPSIRIPRYDPYRRPPAEFYDPYMMTRPGPPPFYHSNNRMSQGRSNMARYHPYSSHYHRK